MKTQVLFSSKDKSKKLKCRLLQFLFGTLRDKNKRLEPNYSYSFQYPCILPDFKNIRQIIYFTLGGVAIRVINTTNGHKQNSAVFPSRKKTHLSSLFLYCNMNEIE